MIERRAPDALLLIVAALLTAIGIVMVFSASSAVAYTQYHDATYYLKRELLWVPAVGLGLRQLHSIAIDRKAGHSAVSQVVEQGKARLDEGDWIMIFPEGTRMPPGETRRYGVSGTLLASETGKLIVPVAHNAGLYWPRRGLRKKPGLIHVVIGPPVAAAGRDVRELNEEIQSWVEATVRSLEPGD